MELRGRREVLSAGAALLVAAVAGGVVALGGAAVTGFGESTSTVREVIRDASPGASVVAQESGNGKALTIAQIYRRAAPGVVQVTTTSSVQAKPNPFFPFDLPQTERALGSGFVYDKAGYIITNYHVIRGADTVEVSFSNNDSMKAKIVGGDPSTDIALLQVKANSRALRPLELGDSNAIQVGDDVLAIGNPFGLARSATRGIVSAIQRPLQAPNGTTIDHVIQTDAPINHGNSGGPLLDARGKVIGVNSAIETGDTGLQGNVGIGFAIPINTVRDVLTQLRVKGRVDHPFIGIEARPIEPSIAELFRLPVKRGLMVERVFPGSGAADGGLRGGTTPVVVSGESYKLDGDIIVKVNGSAVSSTERLRELVAEKKPGDTIELEIYRGENRQTLRIKLGRPPPTPQE
jgi:S1-C subfamily serine protease